MKKRIIFGSVMIAVLLGVFWADWRWEQASGQARAGDTCPTSGLPLAILFLPVLWVGFWEFAKMARALGVEVHIKTGLAGVTLLACLPILNNIFPSLAMPPQLAVALSLMLIFAGQMSHGQLDDALRRVGLTMLGVAYLGLCGGIVMSMRIRFGLPVLVMFLAAVKATDIGAYFTGSFIGKHKMIAWLSPGKSWEGLAGGLVWASLVSVGLWWIFPPNPPREMFDESWASLIKVACFGLVVGVAGQFGDLCESLMKRSAGVKDSGSLVPQFGGALDMLDSPLLAGPIAYVMLIYMF